MGVKASCNKERSIAAAFGDGAEKKWFWCIRRDRGSATRCCATDPPAPPTTPAITLQNVFAPRLMTNEGGEVTTLWERNSRGTRGERANLQRKHFETITKRKLIRTVCPTIVWNKRRWISFHTLAVWKKAFSTSPSSTATPMSEIAEWSTIRIKLTAAWCFWPFWNS